MDGAIPQNDRVDDEVDHVKRQTADLACPTNPPNISVV